MRAFVRAVLFITCALHHAPLPTWGHDLGSASTDATIVMVDNRWVDKGKRRPGKRVCVVG